MDILFKIFHILQETEKYHSLLGYWRRVSASFLPLGPLGPKGYCRSLSVPPPHAAFRVIAAYTNMVQQIEFVVKNS